MGGEGCESGGRGRGLDFAQMHNLRSQSIAEERTSAAQDSARTDSAGAGTSWSGFSLRTLGVARRVSMFLVRRSTSVGNFSRRLAHSVGTSLEHSLESTLGTSVGTLNSVFYPFLGSRAQRNMAKLRNEFIEEIRVVVHLRHPNVTTVRFMLLMLHARCVSCSYVLLVLHTVIEKRFAWWSTCHPNITRVASGRCPEVHGCVHRADNLSDLCMLSPRFKHLLP